MHKLEHLYFYKFLATISSVSYLFVGLLKNSKNEIIMFITRMFSISRRTQYLDPKEEKSGVSGSLKILLPCDYVLSVPL